MLLFQVQRQKKGELTEMQAQFLAAAAEGGLPLPSDPKEFASAVSDIQKSFREHGLSDFISTLTPGAQNAIYAASFAWGYENAARYVKSAMNLEAVKNAASSEDMSKAVVESMQKQSAPHSEKGSEVSRAVWSFYNEDMKETQVQAARSESLTEKEKPALEGREQELQVPQSAAEAVAMGVSQQSISPAVLYCAGVQQEEGQRQVLQAEAEKKEELAKLVSPGQVAAQQGRLKEEAERSANAGEERKALEERIKAGSVQDELLRNSVSSSEMLLALQRREEVLREIASVEKAINTALRMIEKLKADDEEQLKRIISAVLPPALAYDLLRRKNAFFKRINISRQLVQWLAFSGRAKKKLSGMPLGRLIKLISLSKIFGG